MVLRLRPSRVVLRLFLALLVLQLPLLLMLAHPLLLRLFPPELMLRRAVHFLRPRLLFRALLLHLRGDPRALRLTLSGRTLVLQLPLRRAAQVLLRSGRLRGAGSIRCTPGGKPLLHSRSAAALSCSSF